MSQWLNLCGLLYLLFTCVTYADENDVTNDSVEEVVNGATAYKNYRAVWLEKPDDRNHIIGLNDFNERNQNGSFSEVIILDDLVTARYDVLMFVAEPRLQETFDFLKRIKMNYEIGETDIKEWFDKWEGRMNNIQRERAMAFKEENGKLMAPNYYMPYEEVEAYLREVTRDKPSAKVFSIGQSYEGRETWAVSINGDKDLPAIWLDAGLDPSKWLSQAVALYFIFKVLHEESEAAQYMRDNYSWYIVPQVNPDGYVYTWTTDRLWRKTRKPYDDCFGVDMNKNFESVVWETGPLVSNDPCSKRYIGPSSFSEFETRNIQTAMLALKKNLKVYFGLYKHGQAIVTPGLGPSSASGYYMSNDHYPAMERVANPAVEVMKQQEFERVYDLGTAFDLQYPRSATLLDWVYWDKMQDKVTGEVFWLDSPFLPGLKYAYSFDLPPHQGDKENPIYISNPPTHIYPVGTEIFEGINAMLHELEVMMNEKSRDEL